MKPHVTYGPQQKEIFYLGPNFDEGPLPAFIYFSLSAEESLYLHPYNSPASLLSDLPLRIFSFNIPGHGGGLNKFQAISYWAEKMAEGEALLENFFQEVLAGINWLISQNVIDPEKLAVGGLSRGGFIATQIAAMEKRVQMVLGFAPVTTLNVLKEFEEKEKTHPNLLIAAQKLDLLNLCDHLTHLKYLRFYIGNYDTTVSTDHCYHFIKKLSETVHEKRARSCSVELRITPSIGHKGHGTSPQTFEEGAFWIKNHLLRT